MKRQSLLITLIIVINLVKVSENTIIPHLGVLKGQNPSQFRLDLALPPQQRWVEIATKFKTQIKTVVALAEQALKRMPNQGKFFFGFMSLWSKTTFQYKEMAKEIEGIASAAQVPYGMIMFVNLIYEFTTIKSCSGILVRNSTGHILHGRNMDFSRLAAEVHVYRGNQYLFTQDQIIGTVFTLTAFKPMKFSINEDTRFNPKLVNIVDVMKNVFINNYIPSAWLIRKVMEEANSWSQAVKMLNETNITAPIYYIIGGIQGDEGCVIEREPEGVHGYYQLNDTTWFLVQTNYDRDMPDPPLDDRRVPVEKRLKNIGNKFDIQFLFDNVTSKWPTLNIASVITMSAVAATGYHNYTAWYGVTRVNEKDGESYIDY